MKGAKRKGANIKGANRKGEKSTKWIKLGIFGFVLLTFAIATLLMTAMNKKEEMIVAKVNGETIELEELVHMLHEERSGVYQYFFEKYGVTDHEEFWESEFEGEKPQHILKSRALQALIDRKIQLLFAQREGVIRDISYDAFLQDLEAENKEREGRIIRNEPVFGPITYDARTFYRVYLGNAVSAVKAKLLEQDPPNEDERMRVYEETKERSFQNIGSVTFEYARIPIEAESGVALLNELREQLSTQSSSSLSFKQLVQANDFEYGERTMDRSTQNEDLAIYPSIMRELQSMQPGEISEVISERLYQYVIMCVDKQAGGYKPLNEVIGRIDQMIIDNRYVELLKTFEQQAEIILYEDVIETVTLPF